MAMNREQRRYLQKQGQIDAEGNPTSLPRENRMPVKGERATPLRYIREMNAELKRVNWPTRAEVVKYTGVVLVALLFFTGFIAVADFFFGEGIIKLLRLAE